MKITLLLLASLVLTGCDGQKSDFMSELKVGDEIMIVRTVDGGGPGPDGEITKIGENFITIRRQVQGLSGGHQIRDFTFQKSHIISYSKHME